jgi:hypothetical protein
MTTLATYAVKDGDLIKSVHVNFDGYPDHTMKFLVEYYNSQELALELVSQGVPVWSLREQVGFKHSEREHNGPFLRPSCAWTMFAHRDLDYEWDTVKPKEFKTLAEYIECSLYRFCPYKYMFFEGLGWKLYETDYGAPGWITLEEYYKLRQEYESNDE